jgi:DNA mismatch endonuclease (patch repair protein)
MRRIRSKDTTPELTVRKLVWGLGYRYRLHVRELPGCPDLVLRRLKKAIFVHGCFWHQHRHCREGRPPGSRTSYWLPKLQRNVARDVAARRALTRLGWAYLTLWECEIERDPAIAKKLRTFLEGRSP